MLVQLGLLIGIWFDSFKCLRTYYCNMKRNNLKQKTQKQYWNSPPADDQSSGLLYYAETMTNACVVNEFFCAAVFIGDFNCIVYYCAHENFLFTSKNPWFALNQCPIKLIYLTVYVHLNYTEWFVRYASGAENEWRKKNRKNENI